MQLFYKIGPKTKIFLQTLLGIQHVVEQCPPLIELQRNLEDINFQCASTIPIVPSDFNANAAAANNHHIETSPTVTPINGTAWPN